MRTWLKTAIGSAVALLASPLLAPQLLAFPYAGQIGGHNVYSERPLDAAAIAAVRRADALVARSPLPTKTDQSLFLTQGGWRWRSLTRSGTNGPFGLTLAGGAIVLNQNNPAADAVFRRAEIGGTRSLSGVIAHEIGHSAIRRRFGFLASMRYPQWLLEGFCDVVAGSSTLTDGEAEILKKANPNHPSLAYWSGRKRVQDELSRNGGSVHELFAMSRIW